MFALSSATRTPLTILALTSLSIGWSQPSDDRPGISLEARTLTDTLLAGQPLRVFLSVAVGDAGFEGAFALRPEMGRSGFIIEGPRGQVRLSSRDLGDPMVAPGDWLPPNRPNSYSRGFTEGVDLWLLYGLKRSQFIFGSPGEYRVRGWLTVFQGHDLSTYKATDLQSEAVSIQVLEAPPTLAASLWHAPQQIGAFGGSPAPLSQLAEYAGTDEYAKYAKYAAALDPDCPMERRRVLLRQVLDTEPPRQLLDLCLIDLAKTELATGDREAAKQLVEQALKLEWVPQWRKREAEELLRRITVK